MSGRFITFEGADGSGKSTQAALLADRLKASGQAVVLAREPGGTPVGEAIRNILQHDSAGEGMSASTEILLFEASRAALVESVIKPALAVGIWVICDRFADSTTAYQGYGRGYDVEALFRLNALATGGLEPDLTVLLNIDVTEGRKRLQKRISESGSDMDRMEREDRDFHERVRLGYLEIASQRADRFRVIEGFSGIERLEAEIWGIVSDRFKV